jgi:class 3 adenylate cyclase
VNIAARLASSAGAGEIFASEACVRAAGLPAEVGERRAREVKGKSVALDVRVLSAEVFAGVESVRR